MLQRLRRLHERRGRREEGAALLEGPHLLIEAAAAGASIEHVFALPGWMSSRENRSLLAELESRGAALYEVSPKFMARAATTESPPPVIATARLGFTAGEERVQTGLLIDGLQDPGNLGTILRTAWGAGVGLVWVTPDTVEPFSPKVMRAAQGAHFHLSLREIGRERIKAAAGEEKRWLVAAEPAAALAVWQAELREPCLICIGNEARGLGEDILHAADERVAIPLAAGVDSLNAAVSAAVILFELARRRWDKKV